MNSEKMTARIVGVLFITASAAPFLTYPFTGFLLEKAPDYLNKVSASETQVLIGMLFELLWTLAVLGIPVMLFPILKRHNEAGALGFLGLRFLEAVSTIFTSIILLALLTLSHEFVQAEAQDASYYQILGNFALAARDWAFIVGPGLVFALSAVTLNYVLYQSELIPGWLSGWGLVGGLLMIVGYLVQLFVFDQVEILFIPIALQEMAFAVWLIVRGFNSSAIASDTVKTGKNG